MNTSAKTVHLICMLHCWIRW